MSFERARTKEQIENRRQEILNCSIEIYEKNGLDKLNFLEISKKTKFTRPTIYKYFATKEEIMLSMILYYIEKVQQYTSSAAAKHTTYTKEEIADILTAALVDNAKFIQLYAILFTVIEKNVSLEALTSFKKELMKYQASWIASIKNMTNCHFDESAYQFLLTYLALATGLYPMCHMSPLQEQAIKSSGIEYTVPNFQSFFKKAIIIQLEQL